MLVCYFHSDTKQQGGTIRGSINLPAQSLWPTIPTLYSVLKAASVRKVIWYCCMWSSPLSFVEYRNAVFTSLTEVK